MSEHLTGEDLLDLAEQNGTHPHLAACDGCRAKLSDLRDALRRAAEVTVPEPSPLFWDHFSARVHAAVDDAEAVRAGGWRRALAWRPAWAAALVLLAAAVVWQAERGIVSRHAVSRPGVIPLAADETGGEAASATSTANGVAASGEVDSDPSWALVTDAAAEVDLDTAVQAGLALQPGSAEVAALQLSEDEQRALVRLLQAAVERPDSN